MRKIKFEPVAWLTTLSAVLVALASTQAVTDALPARWVGALGATATVVTMVVGYLTRDSVTPLARPRDRMGRALVASVKPGGVYDTRKRARHSAAPKKTAVRPPESDSPASGSAG